MKLRDVTLSLAITFFLLTAPFAAEAQQTKFWAMEAGNFWDYVEGPSDTWPSRVQVTLDTATFSSPTYLMATTEYQNSTWVPMENWRYDILETGLNASELRVWQFSNNSDIDLNGWFTLTSYSGLIWAKRPITVGDSWTFSGQGWASGPLGSDSVGIYINSEVLDYESVDVPFGNGSYNAYKISHSIQILHAHAPTSLTKTIWITPYLGIIKHESSYATGITEKDYLSAMDITTVFNDALYDHWAYPYIMQIYDSRITLGCSLDNPDTPGNEASYCPEDFVTREAMAVFITRALNQVPEDGYCGSTPPFLDVAADRWSCKYVKRLVELGITAGVGQGLFGPEDVVTREQMAVFITRALGQVPADGYCGTTGPFSDVPYNLWSCKYVKRLVELEITTGIGQGLYGPINPVTRAQMAVFLFRAFLAN